MLNNFLIFNICSHSTVLRSETLSCGHSSCQECLGKLVATTVKPSCPLCTTAFANDATLNSNVALNTLTSNLEVACTNDDCGWTGTYERAKDHSKQCPKKKVRCLNEGCQHILTNEEVASHLFICHKQLISCTDCGMSTARDMLALHLSELCLVVRSAAERYYLGILLFLFFLFFFSFFFSCFWHVD